MRDMTAEPIEKLREIPDAASIGANVRALLGEHAPEADLAKLDPTGSLESRPSTQSAQSEKPQ
jgi:hypothetical protein